ncbi:hypothetical protein DH2020_030532 [Rehmannia glutinosa]|uniref:BHLH domain-containing protein n=1 Tax=Rehmannia glutinosa TaxID=99300 RepID=A0ABR0VKK6_REHGL
MTTNPPEGYASDDFLEQILSIPSYAGLAGADGTNPSETTSLDDSVSQLGPSGAAASLHHPPPMFPLSLSLDNGRDAVNDHGAFAVKPEREAVNNNMGVFIRLLAIYRHMHYVTLRLQVQQAYQGLPTASTAVTVPHPPVMRPRVRARRGQATDPHSIAERLRRERISERIKALQELVPSCNKVLSMSRLGGVGAVAQLVADIPMQPIEDETGEIGSNQHVWDKWSNEETEREVAKLMEEDEEPQCNSSNQNHFVSCLFHSQHSSIPLANQMTLHSSNLSPLPLCKPIEDKKRNLEPCEGQTINARSLETNKGKCNPGTYNSENRRIHRISRKIDNELPVHQRADAVSSLVYEANARTRDPVYGCVGAITYLQNQVSQLQMQLAVAQAEILLGSDWQKFEKE